jgi:aspartyl/glutamyl-tRNA(Asn/Gln) amidotransferase C subunit
MEDVQLRERLKKICSQVMLSFSKEEFERFVEEAKKILELFDEIEQLNLEEEKSLFLHERQAKLREDEEKKFEWNPFENANKELVKENKFVGPKIV